MVKKAVMEFYQKGKIVLGTAKDGNTNLRIDLSYTQNYNGKTIVEVEKNTYWMRGGQQVIKRATHWREVKFTDKGMELGKVVMAKGYNTRRRTFALERNVSGRLDTGFEMLMAHFKMDGIESDMINSLRAKWDMLSDTQKAMVWNYYRTQTVDADFGSSSLSQRGAGFALDAIEYVEIMNNSILRLMAE